MTDLGSVTYDSIPDLSNEAESLETTKVEINIPENPQKFRNKQHGIPRKQTPSHPPTIMEAPSMEHEEEEKMPSSPMTDSAKINLKEKGDLHETGKQSDGNGIGSRSLKRTRAIMDSEFHNNIDENRLSSASEKSFGSGDKLTDNDSLEKVDKIGYTNVIADVTVHECNIDNCSLDIADMADKNVHECNIDNCSLDIADIDAQGDVSSKHLTTGMCSVQCNKEKDTSDSENVNIFHSAVNGTDEHTLNEESRVDDSFVNSIADSTVSVEEIEVVEKISMDETTESTLSTNEIDSAEKKPESLEKIERQIIPNGSNSISERTNVNAATDCNKNETKGSVRFKEKEDGEIKEEVIIPVHSTPIEGKPKKDAATKRETWASKKLRKRFGLKEKQGEEDVVDGKGKYSVYGEKGSYLL